MAIEENYNEFFNVFSDMFTNFGRFINEVINPQAVGLGGAIGVILLFVTIFAIIILAFKKGTMIGHRRRF